MKIAAILLCAGNGQRFNSTIPKQYRQLHGKKVYRYPLDILKSVPEFSKIILVIGEGQEQYIETDKDIMMVKGGKTRGKSVFLALQALHNIDYVIICEAVRPFITKNLIKEHIQKLSIGSKAINTCIPCSDTINILENGSITQIPPREIFLRGQTPQSFSFKELYHAHKHNKKTYTDDCALLLEAGEKISYVLGNEENIKITTQVDMALAENLLL